MDIFHWLLATVAVVAVIAGGLVRISALGWKQEYETMRSNGEAWIRQRDDAREEAAALRAARAGDEDVTAKFWRVNDEAERIRQALIHAGFADPAGSVPIGEWFDLHGAVKSALVTLGMRADIATRNLGFERQARSTDRQAYEEALRAAGREKAALVLELDALRAAKAGEGVSFEGLAPVFVACAPTDVELLKELHAPFTYRGMEPADALRWAVDLGNPVGDERVVGTLEEAIGVVIDAPKRGTANRDIGTREVFEVVHANGIGQTGDGQRVRELLADAGWSPYLAASGEVRYRNRGLPGERAAGLTDDIVRQAIGEVIEPDGTFDASAAHDIVTERLGVERGGLSAMGWHSGLLQRLGYDHVHGSVCTWVRRPVDPVLAAIDSVKRPDGSFSGVAAWAAYREAGNTGDAASSAWGSHEVWKRYVCVGSTWVPKSA